MPLQLRTQMGQSHLGVSKKCRGIASTSGIRRPRQFLGVRPSRGSSPVALPSEIFIARASFLESLTQSLRPKPKEASKKASSKTVFVAGSTGRVGARIVRELLQLGYNVRAGCRNVESAQEAIDVAEACECCERGWRWQV